MGNRLRDLSLGGGWVVFGFFIPKDKNIMLSLVKQCPIYLILSLETSRQQQIRQVTDIRRTMHMSIRKRLLFIFYHKVLHLKYNYQLSDE